MINDFPYIKPKEMVKNNSNAIMQQRKNYVRYWRC
jgi:hypothetical protein